MAVYLDDGFFDHAKALLAGEDACLLYIQGLAFTARNDTRGLIVASALPRLTAKRSAPRLARRLVEAGLWEQIDDGWRIHDYEQFNAAQIARREKARKASNARWHPEQSSEQSSEDAPSISREDAPSIAKPCLSNAIPQPQSQPSSSSSNSRGSPQPVDDDEEKRVKAAAKADLEARVAASGKLGKVANPGKWLEKAEADYRSGRKPLPPPASAQTARFFEPIIHHERGDLENGRRAARNGRLLLGIERLPQDADGTTGSVPA